MNTRTVLILGAAGRFGAAAVQAFAAAGWRVLAQQRRTTPLPRGAELVDTALSDTGTLARRAAAASVVIYAVNPPYHRWETELLPLFEQGLAVATKLGARLMLPGSVYNYGEAMPACLDVETPERPSTRKGEQRVAMEDLLRRHATLGLDSVLIRAGDFYGAGRGSWFDQAVVKDIARGKLVYPGPLDLAHAWAYLPDLAQAFVAVAERPAKRGFQRLHFAGHTLTGRALLAAIEAAGEWLGLRPEAGFRQDGMPWRLIRALGVVHPLWRELARMSYLWRVPHALDGSALEAFAGPLPATPLATALGRSLLDLGAVTAQPPTLPLPAQSMQ